MKRIIPTILILAIILSLTACGKPAGSGNGKIKVVCTIFPIYDWTRNIIGDLDNYDLVLLNNNGTDMHSYEPTAADIITISTCDVFIYVGGESDGWVSDVLKNSPNKSRVDINLIEAIHDTGVLSDESDTYPIVWDPARVYDPNVTGDEKEFDEHIWLCLKNAEAFCTVFCDVISKADPENADTYLSNARAYTNALSALDTKYISAVSDSSHKTLLFGDRFPFLYIAFIYELKAYAAFPGCSAETEASFETITFLAGKVDELGLKTILTIDGSDGAVANTIRNNTATKDQQILMLDSLQSVTAKDIENGVTYLSVMEKNLEVLKEALK